MATQVDDRYVSASEGMYKFGFGNVPEHKGASYTTTLHQIHRFLMPKSYLEIGTLTGSTLSLSNCPSIAIDPRFKINSNVIGSKKKCHFFQMTSDDFFAEENPTTLLQRKLDFVFLDGMHIYEYLLRDFINVEKYCRPNSIIAIHDCIPIDSHAARRVATDTAYAKMSVRADWWAGDIWKTILILKKYRPELHVYAFDAPPTGIIFITNLSPDSNVLAQNYFSAVQEFAELTYSDYGIERYFQELDVKSTRELDSASELARYFWL
jgi:hypothetical protein